MRNVNKNSVRESLARAVLFVGWTLCCMFAAFVVPHAAADTPIDPLAPVKGRKAVVLFFVGSDCPISNAYAPEIRRICTRYAAHSIGFYMVYPDPDVTLDVARKHASAYGLPAPVLLDPGHRLCRRTGATVTPEAALLAPDGKLLYRGRIDDLYVGFGKQRYAATRHDLRLALDAVLRGQLAPQPFTKSVGCYIPDVAP